MRRILYYDVNMRVKYDPNLEIIGVGTLDEAKRLLEGERFDLVGINAGRANAFEFACFVNDETECRVAVLTLPNVLSYISGIRSNYLAEIGVERRIETSRLVLAPHPRHIKMVKNLKLLAEILILSEEGNL